MSKENGKLNVPNHIFNICKVSLVVADSWDDADADPVKELMDKVEKVCSKVYKVI